MDIVFAKDTRIAAHPSTGVGVQVVVGSHWPTDDPIVKAYPDLFTDDPRYGLTSSRPLDEDGYPVGSRSAVETATANPGERRTRKQS